MSCFEIYPAGQEIRIAYEIRVGNVLTDPSALRFKYRGPEDMTTTTLTWGPDPEVIHEGVGKFYVDFNPQTVNPAAYIGLWKWRYEVDGVETAEEGEFAVSEPNV